MAKKKNKQVRGPYISKISQIYVFFRSSVLGAGIVSGSLKMRKVSNILAKKFTPLTNTESSIVQF
jgi:hypothetical protein